MINISTSEIIEEAVDSFWHNPVEATKVAYTALSKKYLSFLKNNLENYVQPFRFLSELFNWFLEILTCIYLILSVILSFLLVIVTSLVGCIYNNLLVVIVGSHVFLGFMESRDKTISGFLNTFLIFINAIFSPFPEGIISSFFSLLLRVVQIIVSPAFLVISLLLDIWRVALTSLFIVGLFIPIIVQAALLTIVNLPLLALDGVRYLFDLITSCFKSDDEQKTKVQNTSNNNSSNLFGFFSCFSNNSCQKDEYTIDDMFADDKNQISYS